MKWLQLCQGLGKKTKLLGLGKGHGVDKINKPGYFTLRLRLLTCGGTAHKTNTKDKKCKKCLCKNSMLLTS